MSANQSRPIYKVLLMSAVFAITSLPTLANSELFHEIQQADKTLFDAFNRCDIDTQEKMFSEDLEFYHDIAGMSGLEDVMRVTRENCARELGLVRTLLPESLVVYPVKGFGAIQLGEHRFCHEVNGVDDCGIFGFTHVWKKTEAGWIVHRVVSYGH